MALPPDRLLRVIAAVTDARERESREQFTLAAFVGWQMLAAQGAEVGSFQSYIARLGLTDGG